MGKAEVLPQLFAGQQGVGGGDGSPGGDAAREWKSSPKLGLLKASRSHTSSWRMACLDEKEEKRWIFFHRVKSPVVFLNCSKTSFTLSILSLDSSPWSKSRDKAIWKIGRVHIFNITALTRVVILLNAIVYWAQVYFQQSIYAVPSQRLCRPVSCPPVHLLSLLLLVRHSQGCWLLSSCLFTALLIFIFILLPLKRSL